MHIRKYKEEDRKDVIELAKRFNTIDYMEFRDDRLMLEKQLELVLQAVNHNSHNIYVAEDDRSILGYIELCIHIDYFTKREQGYISAIAVSKNGEGKGIGKALMKHAEDWSNTRS